MSAAFDFALARGRRESRAGRDRGIPPLQRTQGWGTRKESIAEKLISDLEKKVVSFDEAGKIDMASLVRASLMMPGVARLLGIGEAILPTQAPKWLMFSYLRMAHLVHTGAVCDGLGLQAAKIPFGGEKLASAAFGVQPAAELADQYASYVLSERFDSNLGAALVSQPGLLQNILRFERHRRGRHSAPKCATNCLRTRRASSRPLSTRDSRGIFSWVPCREREIGSPPY